MTNPNHLLAALQGLSKTLNISGPPHTMEEVTLFLYRIGEAYHLGVEVPANLQMWLDSVGSMQRADMVSWAVSDIEGGTEYLPSDDIDSTDLTHLLACCDGVEALIDRYSTEISVSVHRSLQVQRLRLESLWLKHIVPPEFQPPRS